MKTRLTRIISPGFLPGIALALACLPAGAVPDPALPARPALTPVKGLSASALARNHWQAIAAGDVAGVMGGYGPAPTLHWDGGAFDGDHVGAPAIQTVWTQFAHIRAPLQVQVSDAREQGGAGGSRIVTAYTVFRSRVWTYEVVYRLVFRQGRIVEETWRLAEPGDGPVVNAPA